MSIYIERFLLVRNNYEVLPATRSPFQFVIKKLLISLMVSFLYHHYIHFSFPTVWYPAHFESLLTFFGYQSAIVHADLHLVFRIFLLCKGPWSALSRSVGITTINIYYIAPEWVQFQIFFAISIDLAKKNSRLSHTAGAWFFPQKSHELPAMTESWMVFPFWASMPYFWLIL